MSHAFTLSMLTLFGLFIAGVPVGYTMMVAGAVYVAIVGADPGLVAEQVLNGMFENYTILAVPLFILAANLMNAGNISNRLLSFCLAAFGRFRGGLAHVNIVTNVLFAGMSGSAVADAAGMGRLITNLMLKTGRYSPGFAAALTAAASTIAPVIPPSIPMILYALVSGASIGYLFIGGLLPGMLMGASLMGIVMGVARRNNFQPDEVVPLRELPKRTFMAIPVLMLPVILIVGLRGGAMTPTEAAAVCAFYAFLLAAFFYRELSVKGFLHHMIDAAKASASVGVILSGAFLINYIAASENLPAKLAVWISDSHFSALTFMLVVNVMFLVMGCMFDTIIMLLVVIPMLVPSCRDLGIDLVYFGVVLVVNMMIGLITPPFGVLLFILNGVTGIPLSDIIRESWKFIFALLAVLAFLVLCPDFVLFLPRLLGYQG
ncbi:MAG: TRAP transporter large permease [Methylobacteriaceae bacterium]|jgi:tripartite ATP-independent transporter DctM subunit|nr:TRAP transporter large permease [Methylobacteriaceae bacterium]